MKSCLACLVFALAAAVCAAGPVFAASPLSSQLEERPEAVSRPYDPGLDPIRRVVPSGSEPAIGDLVRSERSFAAWTIHCEALLSRGAGRSCEIVEPMAGGIRVRVALTASLRPVLLIEAGSELQTGPVVVEVGNVVQPFPATTCDDSSCVTGVMFGGPLEAALSSGRDIFLRWGPVAEHRTGVVRGHGFAEAAASLAGPPDGAPYGAVACGSRDDAGWSQ